MNGAEALVRTLLAGGVDVCFTNPGTSEMYFVEALDRVEAMRCVLCLFENVATGAADGYARMADRPASTLLHLGPGLANGLSNLHNARRAFSPVVNIVGEHASYHKPFDAPLTSDIAGVAAPFSDWVGTVGSVNTIGADTAEAIRQSRAAPGRIATLIAPAETSWLNGGVVSGATQIDGPREVSEAALECAAALIRTGEPTLLVNQH